jgi:hypothetical protein
MHTSLELKALWAEQSLVPHIKNIIVVVVLEDMLHKPIAMSAIALVVVAAILMLSTLAAISTNKQAFAQHKQVWYMHENGKTYVCKRNIHQNGYGHCTLLYEKPAPPPPPSIKTGGEEQESQTALLKQDCMQLKEKMANDEPTAAQYKSKDCESLLK